MKVIETHPREIGFVLWGHCQNLLDDPRIRDQKVKSVRNYESPMRKRKLWLITRLAPVLKTIFHQCAIYTCSLSNSDGSVLNRAIRVRLATSIDEILF